MLHKLNPLVFHTSYCEPFFDQFFSWPMGIRIEIFLPLIIVRDIQRFPICEEKTNIQTCESSNSINVNTIYCNTSASTSKNFTHMAMIIIIWHMSLTQFDIWVWHILTQVWHSLRYESDTVWCVSLIQFDVWVWHIFTYESDTFWHESDTVWHNYESHTVWFVSLIQFDVWVWHILTYESDTVWLMSLIQFDKWVWHNLTQYSKSQLDQILEQKILHIPLQKISRSIFQCGELKKHSKCTLTLQVYSDEGRR